MLLKIIKTKPSDYILNNWSDLPIWFTYNRIHMFLENNLDKEHNHLKDFLAKPEEIHSDCIQWYAMSFDSQPQQLTSLSQEEYFRYKSVLEAAFSVFYEMLQKHQVSEEWKELLERAILLPNEDNVFCADDKVVITNWGTRKKGLTEDSTLSIKTNLKKEVPKTVFVPPIITHENKEQNIEEEEEKAIINDGNTTDEFDAEREVLETDNYSKDDYTSADENKQNIETDIPNNTANDKIENTLGAGGSDGDSNYNERKKPLLSKPLKILLGILLLLLLVFLASLLFRKCTSDSVIPEKPGVIRPIPPEDLDLSKDSLTTVASNRLNILIKDKGKVKSFMRDFVKAYPQNDKYKVVYYNEEVQRVQILIPKKEKEKVRGEIKGKLSGYNIVVWDETLFNNDFKPSDPAFKNTEKSWYFQSIKAYGGWEKTMGEKFIKVAVVDDGFDITHSELKTKIIDQYNSVTKEHKVTSTKDGHGTHVAATAVGAINGEGSCGIAPKCELMVIQVTDSRGTMTTTAIIDGILYAIFNGADVVNVSLGQKFSPMVKLLPVGMQMNLIQTRGKAEEEVWKQIFALAEEKGCTIVLAGGNEDILIGLDPMQRSPHTIKVAAVQPNFAKANFSNYGYYTTISAPGVHIYNAFPKNKYAYMDGTSMAAPIVTGAVALLKSVHSNYSTGQIVELLRKTGLASRSANIAPVIQLDKALGVAQNTPPEKVPDPNKGYSPLLPLEPGSPDYPGGAIEPGTPQNPNFPVIPKKPQYPKLPKMPGYKPNPDKYPRNPIIVPVPKPVLKPKPERPCTDVQEKIDSLEKVIAELKKQCQSNLDTLKITPRTTLVDIAGMWKSTTPLYDDAGAPVELLFEINSDGTGRVFYNQRGNKSFSATTSVTLANSQIHIEQLAKAQSKKHKDYFSIYHFDCVPHLKTAIAEGAGFRPNKKNMKIVKFNLIKL